MDQISNEQVNTIIQGMLDAFYLRDEFLMKRDRDITERAITHRMAMHLQQLIPEMDVDCEFNRMGKFDQNIEYTDGDYFAKRVCLATGERIIDDDDQGSRVFPDIIVHKRGTAINLIIIEVKVTWKSGKKSHDIEKLNAYKTDLKYPHAFYLEMFENRDDVIVTRI